MSATPFVVFWAVAACTLPLAAQDRTPTPVLGVGITVPDVGVLLPINVSQHVRLEPYVDFYSTRADYPVTSDTAWASHARIGLGLFSVAHPRERLGLYFGPRFGLLRGSTRINGSAGQTSTKSSGWFLGGAIGAEYSPVPGLSVGAEAKIEFDHSSSSSTGSTSIAPNLYARSWFSSGVLVVRFYP
jgi:hypothetical protein